MGFSDELVNSVDNIYLSITVNNVKTGRGVLQGSILSPELLKKYLDDLIKELKKSSI